jgi:hypothetical protein
MEDISIFSEWKGLDGSSMVRKRKRSESEVWLNIVGTYRLKHNYVA